MYNYSGYHETIEKARKTANRRFPSSTYEAYVDNPLNQESLLFRPEFIYSMVKSYIPGHPKRIADIGGGEGHNLIGFQKNNAECFVLDVADGPQKVHGIKKTKKFEELKRYAPYHVMVSTHTLEHIVNVGDFLDQYTPLADYFYCEVPSQYSIRYLKIRKPFLTEHVNYFSISSLRYLFENGGFRTLHLSVKYLPYQIFRMPVLVGIFQRIKSTPSAFVKKSHFLPFLIRELAIFAHIHIYHRLHGHYPPLYF